MTCWAESQLRIAEAALRAHHRIPTTELNGDGTCSTCGPVVWTATDEEESERAAMTTIIDDKALLTFDEKLEAENLERADRYSRALDFKCWSDPNVKVPFVESACNDEDTSACVLGLCPEHCVAIHGGCHE